jgi:uncharacterized protein (UPF0332 family)
MTPSRRTIPRRQNDLKAARYLLSAGFTVQAVSRAYQAGFVAAEAALQELGETRSKHSGVISAFTRIVVREGGLGQEMDAVLRSLFSASNEADYQERDVPTKEAETVVGDAERFVDAVEEWLAARSDRGQRR